MHLNLEIVKKHPVATGAVILVGGLILFLLLRSGGSGGTTVVQGASAANPQADNNAFQLQSQAQAIQGQFALTSLQGEISTTQQVNAITGQTNLAGMQEHVQLATIDSQNYQTVVAAQTQVALATMETQANVAINAANIDLQKTIAGYSKDTVLGLAGYQAEANREQLGVFAAMNSGGGGTDWIGTALSIGAMFL